jgi:hypothetical protein
MIDKNCLILTILTTREIEVGSTNTIDRNSKIEIEIEIEKICTIMIEISIKIDMKIDSMKIEMMIGYNTSINKWRKIMI